MISADDLNQGLRELAKDPGFREEARRYYAGLSDALCRAQGLCPNPTKDPRDESLLQRR